MLPVFPLFGAFSVLPAFPQIMLLCLSLFWVSLMGPKSSNLRFHVKCKSIWSIIRLKYLFLLLWVYFRKISLMNLEVLVFKKIESILQYPTIYLHITEQVPDRFFVLFDQENFQIWSHTLWLRNLKDKC